LTTFVSETQLKWKAQLQSPARGHRGNTDDADSDEDLDASSSSPFGSPTIEVMDRPGRTPVASRSLPRQTRSRLASANHAHSRARSASRSPSSGPSRSFSMLGTTLKFVKDLNKSVALRKTSPAVSKRARQRQKHSTSPPVKRLQIGSPSYASQSSSAQ